MSLAGCSSPDSAREQGSLDGDGDTQDSDEMGLAYDEIALAPEDPILAGAEDGGLGGAGALDASACLRFMSWGSVARYGAVPGEGGKDALVEWLNLESNGVGEHFQEKPELTEEFLQQYDLLLVQNLSGWTWESAELQLVEDWVRAGGAILTLAGFSQSGEEVLPTNQLVSFSGLNYIGISGAGDTSLSLSECSYCLGTSHSQEGWSDSHPAAQHIAAVGAHLGRSIGGEGDLVAQEEGKILAMTQEVDEGRVYLFHDDWVSYTGQWNEPPTAECQTNLACADFTPGSSYQVPQFWYNAFRYLVPGASCFVIEDDAIVHQSRE